MALKQFRYEDCTILMACNAHAEISVGDKLTSKLLNKNPLWPDKLVFVLVAIEVAPPEEKNWNRRYILEYDDAVLNGGPEPDGCDLVEITPFCCCDELADALAAEVAAREAADITLTQNIVIETNRATTAEGILTSGLEAEVLRSTTQDTALSTALAAEILRSTTQDTTLSEKIVAETTRATTAEGILTSGLAAEIIARETEDEALDQAITVLENGVVRHDIPQALTPTQQTQALNNLGTLPVSAAEKTQWNQKVGNTVFIDPKYPAASPAFEMQDLPYASVAAIPSGVKAQTRVYKFRNGLIDDVTIDQGGSISLDFSEVSEVNNLNVKTGLFKTSGCPSLHGLSIDSSNFVGDIGGIGSAAPSVFKNSYINITCGNIEPKEGNDKPLIFDGCDGYFKFHEIKPSLTGNSTVVINNCNRVNLVGQVYRWSESNSVAPISISGSVGTTIDIDEIHGAGSALHIAGSMRTVVKATMIDVHKNSSDSVVAVIGRSPESAVIDGLVHFHVDRLNSFVPTQYDSSLVRARGPVYMFWYNTVFEFGSQPTPNSSVFFTEEIFAGNPTLVAGVPGLVLSNCVARCSTNTVPLFKCSGNCLVEINGTLKTNTTVLNAAGYTPVVIKNGTVELNAWV